MKTIYDLTREEIIEVKQNYLVLLADEGRFAEVVGVDYDAPAWGDLADADTIVPDDVIFEEYADTIFSEDDFSKDE